MIMKRILFFLVLGIAVSTWASEWKLAVDDQFDSETSKNNWIPVSVTTGEKPQMHIKDGKGFVTGIRSGFFYKQELTGNVKVIFNAQWNEQVGNQMVQFGAGFYCDRDFPNRTGIHLVHGKFSNTSNAAMIYFISTRARNKGPLPKPGESLEMEGSVENGVATLKRNGETILTYKIPDKEKVQSGGYLFFPANEEHLKYDRIRVYYQEPPPVVAAKYQEGRSAELDALMADLKKLSIEAPTKDWQKAFQTISAFLKKHPELDTAAPGEEKLSVLTAECNRLTSIDFGPRSGLGGWLKPRLAPSHPYYAKFMFDYGRGLWAVAQEQRDPMIFDRTRKVMAEVQANGYNYDVLKMYAGELIPWGKELILTDSQAPEWALLQYEARRRCHAIIDWWVTQRQSERGTLGGGWNDDVEILRVWAPLAMISNGDPIILEGIKKLVDGAWKYAEGGLELGYSKALGDVEHSSEASGDTQPIMLGLAPEDDTYAQRNMLLAGLVKNLWTGRTPQGHLHFKSAYISARKIDDSPQRQASTPYHTRVFKGLTWLAWRGGHPEATQIVLDFAEAWRAAAMDTSDGKPAGAVPSAVAWSTGRLGGLQGNWHDPGLAWSYFKFDRANSFRIYSLLQNAYILTGDRKFIEPMLSAVKMALEPYRGPAEPEVKTADFAHKSFKEWFEKGHFSALLTQAVFIGNDPEAAKYLEIYRQRFARPVEHLQAALPDDSSYDMQQGAFLRGPGNYLDSVDA